MVGQWGGDMVVWWVGKWARSSVDEMVVQWAGVWIVMMDGWWEPILVVLLGVKLVGGMAMTMAATKEVWLAASLADWLDWRKVVLMVNLKDE